MKNSNRPFTIICHQSLAMAASKYSLLDTSWELIDPNPDVHQLFSEFNKEFFWGQLGSVYVDWSSRMTSCAGLCKCSIRGQFRDCSISLSQPLLSLRPRKDLVETLLHEMIHAYLFVAEGSRDREGHGPDFLAHMNRINNLTGAKISVYHSFHDEVKYFKTHWWKCDGPCQHRPPYFGMVKRSMNRAPGPNDLWHSDHQRNCGGKFVKVKEPSPKPTSKRKKETSKSPARASASTAAKKTTRKVSPSKAAKVGSSKKPATITSAAPSSSGSLNFPKSTSSTPSVFSGRGHVLGSGSTSTPSVSNSVTIISGQGI
ncbi:unnamed protein product [Orchesella dallaii]|uniref:SprT-like domain-containing protein n=1 Tax=Orchesella dallaii TaxID=48710 RepID=A0ABP1RIQ8_9HEXA